MANTFNFGSGKWAAKEGSVLAYNNENNNFKPLPFTFTRASTATRVNESGLIESVASGVPRIDFLDNADGHLLLEPSRTNVFTDSEDISTWVNSGTLTRTYNIDTAPDGAETADGIQDETGGTFKYVYKQFSVSANATMTGSVFVKKVTSETNYMGIFLLFSGGTTKIAYGIIKSVNGTIVSADSTITPTFKVDDYGDYWRFSITATDNGSNTLCRFGVYACLSTNGTTLGVGVSSLRTIWGAQLEAGSYATSYIPTSDAAVTRAVDDIQLLFPSSSSFSSSSGFTSIIEFGVGGRSGSSSSPFIQINDTDASTYMAYGSSGANWRCRLNISGTSYLNTATNASRDSVAKLAISSDSNGWSQCANGDVYASGVQDASALNVLASITFLTSDLYGQIKIRSLKIYNTRLSDSELESLTS